MHFVICYRNIPKDKKGKIKAVRLIHGNHTKGLFSIAIPYGPKYVNKYLLTIKVEL